MVKPSLKINFLLSLRSANIEDPALLSDALAQFFGADLEELKGAMGP